MVAQRSRSHIGPDVERNHLLTSNLSKPFRHLQTPSGVLISLVRDGPKKASFVFIAADNSLGVLLVRP